MYSAYLFIPRVSLTAFLTQREKKKGFCWFLWKEGVESEGRGMCKLLGFLRVEFDMCLGDNNFFSSVREVHRVDRKRITIKQLWCTS